MRNYKITVTAYGYETLVKTVRCASMADARRLEGVAKREWCTLNDVRYGTVRLAFVHTTLVR